MITLEDKKHQPEPNSTTLFVVGMWRSGTSLFYALLNQHPQIKLMYEDELPLLWPLFLGRGAKKDWPERWEFWNQALSRHKIDPADLPHRAAGLREACEAAWALYAPHAAIRGGKSPSYFDCLPQIAKEFPNAKFLVMWRDPADVCRSVVRAQSDSFFAKRGMMLRALLGCRDLKCGYDALVARGVPVYPVQYEDLVENPTAVMKGVCSFLDIEFDPRMASLRGADRSAIYEGDHHEGVNLEKIVAKKKSEVLPEPIQRKLESYIAHWKRESSGTWPAHAEPVETGSKFRFVFERLFDRAAYRALRAFDQCVALLYSYLPLGMLRKYRASKRRPVAVVASKPGEQELVGASQKNSA